MAFPIYYQGKILFRDGVPAFSTNCCCGPGNNVWGVCIQLQIGAVSDAILTSPPTPPLPQDIGMLGSAFIQYAVYSYNDGPGSSFKEYQTYAWLIQFCVAGPNGRAPNPDAYMAELFSWANDPASIGWAEPMGTTTGYLDCQNQATLTYSGLPCSEPVPPENSVCEILIENNRPLCYE